MQLFVLLIPVQPAHRIGALAETESGSVMDEGTLIFTSRRPSRFVVTLQCNATFTDLHSIQYSFTGIQRHLHPIDSVDFANSKTT